MVNKTSNISNLIESVVVVVAELPQAVVQGGGRGAGGALTSPARTETDNTSTIRAEAVNFRMGEDS